MQGPYTIQVMSDFFDKGPIMPSFDVFFVVSLNAVEQQWSCCWFETQYLSCDATVMWYILMQRRHVYIQSFVQDATDCYGLITLNPVAVGFPSQKGHWY